MKPSLFLATIAFLLSSHGVTSFRHQILHISSLCVITCWWMLRSTSWKLYFFTVKFWRICWKFYTTEWKQEVCHRLVLNPSVFWSCPLVKRVVYWLHNQNWTLVPRATLFPTFLRPFPCSRQIFQQVRCSIQSQLLAAHSPSLQMSDCLGTGPVHYSDPMLFFVSARLPLAVW